jgi:hypothetical protein
MLPHILSRCISKLGWEEVWVLRLIDVPSGISGSSLRRLVNFCRPDSSRKLLVEAGVSGRSFRVVHPERGGWFADTAAIKTYVLPIWSSIDDGRGSRLILMGVV